MMPGWLRLYSLKQLDNHKEAFLMAFGVILSGMLVVLLINFFYKRIKGKS